MNPKLKMLCELYDRSDESIDVNDLLKICFFKNMKEVLDLVSLKCYISFLHKFCMLELPLVKDSEFRNELRKFLMFIGKWLNNPNAIKNSDLNLHKRISCRIHCPDTNYEYIICNIDSALVSILHGYKFYSFLHKLTNYKYLGVLVQLVKEEHEP